MKKLLLALYIVLMPGAALAQSAAIDHTMDDRYPHVWAYIGFHEATPGGGETITLTTGGTYYDWTTSNLSDSGGDITVHSTTQAGFTPGPRGAGAFEIMCDFSYSGTANAVFEVSIFIDDVGTGIESERKLGTGGDQGNHSLHGIIDVANGERVSFQWTSENDTRTILIHHANCSVKRL